MQQHTDTSCAEPALASGARRRFGDTDLGLLLTLAAPNVVGTAGETMLSFVDYAIVSQIGPTAQAGVQSGTMVFFTVYAFLLGMMLCVTTVVSQSLGANRPRDCSAYAWQGIWLSMIFGVLGFVLWPAMPELYRLIGHAPDVQAMEVDYTRIRVLGIGVAGATVALGHFFNGIHQPLHNAISVILANIVNGFLTYGLVFGAWGLPEMGVGGAALASVASSVLRCAWLIAAMCWGPRTARFEARRTIRWDRDKVRRLLDVGWPAGVAIALDIAAWACFLTLIVGQFGTTHLAASATCWRFTELSFMPALGIGFAVSTLVGKAIGEGRPELARRRVRLGAIVNMAYMGSMGAVFVLLGPQLMSLFADAADVIAVGAQLLIFVAVFQLFDAVALTYSNALRGAGDTRWPMVVGAALAWSVMVGGGVLTARYVPQWESSGPWAFATLFVIVIGVVLWLRWRGGRWEELDVIGRNEPQPADAGVTPVEMVPGERGLPTADSRIGSPAAEA